MATRKSLLEWNITQWVSLLTMSNRWLKHWVRIKIHDLLNHLFSGRRVVGGWGRNADVWEHKNRQTGMWLAQTSLPQVPTSLCKSDVVPMGSNTEHSFLLVNRKSGQSLGQLCQLHTESVKKIMTDDYFWRFRFNRDTTKASIGISGSRKPC